MLIGIEWNNAPVMVLVVLVVVVVLIELTIVRPRLGPMGAAPRKDGGRKG